VCAGVPEVVAQLTARGAVLGLVTGNLSQIGWRKVELAGLGERFSIGAFAEHGTTRTRLAQVAARRAINLRLVARNCRVSLIGDHPNDIEAAKRNGFQAVAVATGLTSAGELQAWEPDILVRDLTELDPGELI
jgi:phosphoglycolate phosphatase